MPKCLPIPELIERQSRNFRARAPKSDGCWEWTGNLSTTGYGRVSLGGQVFLAHRVAYFLANGECPTDLLIRHTCHNHRCCNPSHLISGSSADNSQDMVDHGRSTRGEQNYASVLTDKNVATIKTKLITPCQNQIILLAREYEVCPSSIRNIKSGKTWKHIEVVGFNPTPPALCNRTPIPELTLKQLRNFWARVRKGVGKDDCWEWVGDHIKKGYGRLRLGGRNFLAHRVSFFLANGELPSDLIIRHTCNNPPCCNPNHLKSGTCADNTRDRIVSGRSIRGEQNCISVLTEEFVTAIKIACKTPFPGQIKLLAKKYKVHVNTIQTIKAGRSWAHVRV